MRKNLSRRFGGCGPQPFFWQRITADRIPQAPSSESFAGFPRKQKKVAGQPPSGVTLRDRAHYAELFGTQIFQKVGVSLVQSQQPLMPDAATKWFVYLVLRTDYKAPFNCVRQSNPRREADRLYDVRLSPHAQGREEIK
jgi:hypothetical protein